MNTQKEKIIKVYLMACFCLLLVLLAVTGVQTVAQRTGGDVFAQEHAVMSAALNGEKLTVGINGGESLSVDLTVAETIYRYIRYVLPMSVNAAVVVARNILGF